MVSILIWDPCKLSAGETRKVAECSPRQNNSTHQMRIAGTNELIGVVADLVSAKKKRKLGVDYIDAEGEAQGHSGDPGNETDSATEGDAEGRSASTNSIVETYSKDFQAIIRAASCGQKHNFNKANVTDTAVDNAI
ncbi:hypothetical protein HDU86_006755 [Geranomyces michiganensis]|nr:hypothetical protein HDU86_006755 [Geranomyces michiganensis]